MNYRCVIVPRQLDPHTVLTGEALTKMAAEITAKGTIEVRDPNGARRSCNVSDITITDKGIEGTIASLEGT